MRSASTCLSCKRELSFNIRLNPAGRNSIVRARVQLAIKVGEKIKTLVWSCKSLVREHRLVFAYKRVKTSRTMRYFRASENSLQALPYLK